MWLIYWFIKLRIYQFSRIVLFCQSGMITFILIEFRSHRFWIFLSKMKYNFYLDWLSSGFAHFGGVKQGAGRKCSKGVIHSFIKRTFIRLSTNCIFVKRETQTAKITLTVFNLTSVRKTSAVCQQFCPESFWKSLFFGTSLYCLMRVPMILKFC